MAGLDPVSLAVLFLSTLSLRRATIEFDSRHSDQNISIHALLAESDYRFRRDLFTAQALFLSTLSLRRATWCMSRKTPVQAAFLSTLSLRRATILSPLSNSATYISIHALLAESDGSFFFSLESQLTFLSTLSLRRATPTARLETIANTFLSTLSLRRATKQQAAARRAAGNFYPRSPCGERRLTQTRLAELSGIFLSTLSLRRATLGQYYLVPFKQFLSTLSLRRATKFTFLTDPHWLDFYPRSPCGERRVAVFVRCAAAGFLSTLSLRRATCFST